MTCFHGDDALKPALKKPGDGKADRVVIVCLMCGGERGESVHLIDLVQESMGLPPFPD